MEERDVAPTILVVTDDVLFWAAIEGTARKTGRRVVRIADDSAMRAAFEAGGVDRVLADLGSRSVDVRAWAARWKTLPAPPRLIAYGSHVDAAGLASAREAGFDDVMPNSRFHRLLPELIA